MNWKKTNLFLLALIIWMLLALPMDLENFLLGILASGLVTAIFGKYFMIEDDKLWHPKRFLWLLYYIPVFLYYMVKANLDVLYRVLHPDMPIRPGIVKAKVGLKNKLARALLANSITLTPGTLSMDLRGDEIIIHWINVQTEDETEVRKMIFEKFERILKEIFE
ncbi:MAG TPA: Na+/H+ antiporter subunit E [bacterium]|nr:Na+/H+ antiporter subunit E [bacterium]